MEMRTLYVTLLALLFFSCAEDFVPVNPVDPDNPDYVPPIVSIVSGPTEGQTLLTETAVFTFSGNQESMLFRTRLDSGYWSAGSLACPTPLNTWTKEIILSTFRGNILQEIHLRL